jgi:hypothetical protein
MEECPMLWKKVALWTAAPTQSELSQISLKILRNLSSYSHPLPNSKTAITELNFNISFNSVCKTYHSNKSLI